MTERARWTLTLFADGPPTAEQLARVARALAPQGDVQPDEVTVFPVPASSDAATAPGTGSGQRDHQNQRRQGADSDPDPLLTGQTRRLELLEILRELVQILG